MIRKIDATEYLKRYDNMSVGERSAFEGRVVEWLRDNAQILAVRSDSFEAKFQNVITLSSSWNDRECLAFEKGAVLLSALINSGETWLPDALYTKAAGRCIKRMCRLLGMVLSENGAAAMSPLYTGQAAALSQEGDNSPFRGQRNGNRQGEDKGMHEDAAADTAKTAAAPPVKQAYTDVYAGTGVPVRPKHIDQYVHLLPVKTQQRAANYGPLMRELDEMREKERLLMDADGVSDKEREAVAKRIVAIDSEIGGIRKELDAEWEKLVKAGRVVVDDLGMARVVPGADAADPATGDGRNAAGAPDRELTAEQKARRRELRKFLTDTRRGNGKTREEHLVKWREAWREYLTLEPQEAALGDEKISEAAVHYGITLERTETEPKHTEVRTETNDTEQL